MEGEKYRAYRRELNAARQKLSKKYFGQLKVDKTDAPQQSKKNVKHSVERPGGCRVEKETSRGVPTSLVKTKRNRHTKKCCFDDFECLPLDEITCPSITLETQTQVDQFKETGCTVVDGTLAVQDSGIDPILNLRGLCKLRKVSALVISNNASLTTLKGLCALEYVVDNLVIQNNQALESVEGDLCSLTRVGGSLIIANNAALLHLDNSFERLELADSIFISTNPLLVSIGGFNSHKLQFNNARIIQNAILQRIDGFQNVRIVTSAVNINNNESLETINGFNGPMHSVQVLAISFNNALNSISGFRNVTAVFDDITITSNSLTAQSMTINGFNSLKTIGGNLEITVNPALVAVNGFVSLDSVQFDVTIFGNDNLLSFDGLSTLATSSAEISVNNNAALTNIDGLLGLLRVDFGVDVNNNAQLDNVDGLSGLAYSASAVGSQVVVTNNTVLEDFCGLQPLAVTDPTGNPVFTINGNAADPQKPAIALLPPCDARVFFERVLDRFLAEETITKSGACSLAYKATAKNVQCLAAENQIGRAQANLLLQALVAGRLACQKCLPPRGKPLELTGVCCPPEKVVLFNTLSSCKTRRPSQKQFCKCKAKQQCRQCAC